MPKSDLELPNQSKWEENDDHVCGKLQSNWYRYDNKEGDEIPDTSRDFSILSNASLYQGNFEFKTDKALFEDTNLTINNDLFHLDLKLLDLSLSSVPFYELCGMDRDFFKVRKYNKFFKSRFFF